ncbi:MAG: DUF1015 domain-containing protein [Lachnospiraceae bacterium]|nr:DUF1015 domain-containing protein [Lachnospiraceae bacterium]
MAVVRPFRAFRPAKGKEAAIAALPYDVMNRREAAEMVRSNPDSFLCIDRAETQFPDDVDTYADCVYEKAASLLREKMADGTFVQDPAPCYYLYEQTLNGRVQTGIVGCAAIDDYLNGIILRHENTREEKELDRIRHVDTCGAQTGPIFLTYRSRADLDALTARIRAGEPECDFVSAGDVRNRVFVIDAPDDIEIIRKAFEETQHLYIADGHHRCASAVKVGLKRRQTNPDYTGEEEFNYFLSVLFPEKDLMILDYNRVLKSLAGQTPGEILSRIREAGFDISEEDSGEPAKPSCKGEFGLYLSEKWYRLRADAGLYPGDPVGDLDVSVLQKNILEPVFGILDPRTDPKIDFVGGIRGLHELELRCHTDAVCAFAMYPTSIEELFAVADTGALMPPKSTWFEPKLLSGLFIHEINA